MRKGRWENPTSPRSAPPNKNPRAYVTAVPVVDGRSWNQVSPELI